MKTFRIFRHEGEDVVFFPAWVNLINHIHNHEKNKTPHAVWNSIYRHLEKHRARFNYDQIEFENENDAVLFLLRWS